MVANSHDIGWDADPVVQAWEGFPPLPGPTSADVCVVGLGGSGLAAIEELTARGLSVVGVDAGRVAAGAAGRNGGILACGGAESFADSVRDLGADLTVELYRRTLEELEHLSDELGPEVIRRCGSLQLAGLPGEPEDDTEAAELVRDIAQCERELAVLRELGLPAQDYDGELGRGVFFPDNAAMNPVRRAFGLARAVASRARLHERSRVRWISPGRVETEHGVITASSIVVAVDGRLDVLLPQLASRVRTVRLQMLATRGGLPLRLPCPVAARSDYDYAQQDEQGRLFVGGERDRFLADEETVSDTATEQVQSRIELVAQRFAGGPVSVEHRWAASAGFTPDRRPLCGLVDEAVVACGGYSGTGNLVGAVAGRAAVALVIDGVVPAAYFTTDLS